MWSSSVSSFSECSIIHRWHGRLPFPWWLMALLSIFRPCRTDFHPRSRVWSHSFAHPGDSATLAIIGAFSPHFFIAIFLSASMIILFMSLRPRFVSFLICACIIILCTHAHFVLQEFRKFLRNYATYIHISQTQTSLLCAGDAIHPAQQREWSGPRDWHT